jgi:membrane-bound lytic murein transglycosylase B
LPQVTQAEQTQPEFTRSFQAYTGRMLTSTRVATGQNYVQAHADLLQPISARTGVPASVIVALWGLETNYGRIQGNHPVIPALINLAYQSPRAPYFRQELFNALAVVKRTQTPPAQLKGSWAGAMGQCQFMPSSYLAYGTDGNADGRVDIWQTPADVFASTATYLRAKGWQPGQPWRIALAQPLQLNGLSVNQRGLSQPQSLAAWRRRGLLLPEQTLPRSSQWQHFQPVPGGPAYLVGPNFQTILAWNNSSYYAYSVLSLADSLTPKPTGN